jgi:hypothetical protein
MKEIDYVAAKRTAVLSRLLKVIPGRVMPVSIVFAIVILVYEKPAPHASA